jgi:hypothetical protein
MERFKQTIAKLENDVAELKQFQTKIQGSTQTKGDIRYCTSTQEFGEYALGEIDTFRFSVVVSTVLDVNMYAYSLLNPTPELTAYLGAQGKWGGFSTGNIPIDTENFETYCMKENGTPFALTDEIRKCLDSKLWEFAADFTYSKSDHYRLRPGISKELRREFYIDIPITFEHTYMISPHVSFYITPIDREYVEVEIHEITTTKVVFHITYGYLGRKENREYIIRGYKLNYNVNGVVKQYENLLD